MIYQSSDVCFDETGAKQFGHFNSDKSQCALIHEQNLYDSV